MAQSIAWAYAPLARPYTESDPLDVEAQGLRAVSVGGVAALERGVQDAGGTVLRYGQLWGEGTGSDTPDGKDMALHIDGAVAAAMSALACGATGTYNIADDDTRLDLSRARKALGWSPVSPGDRVRASLEQEASDECNLP